MHLLLEDNINKLEYNVQHVFRLMIKTDKILTFDVLGNDWSQNTETIDLKLGNSYAASARTGNRIQVHREEWCVLFHCSVIRRFFCS
ncbi:hypothetical protein CHS0354_006564 [Potamilus streckersoni]|uniref:Uncharacterized protein n=1 Tax=Potamilus streckersoni TaxID=2493646 RepID=A0AAE0WBD7_9BIVA|nr:hypothetical protein CHS0354_006564 [Potamilus streckersoni]